MKCPHCDFELSSYTFTKQVTKSGNSLVITLTNETRKVLELKLGDLLQVTITKLS